MESLMRTFNTLTGIVVFCLFYSCTSSENSFYVSNEGDDSNPGTIEKPFRTLEKINSLQLKPGAKIYLNAGNEFKGTLRLSLNGEANNPIIITSYGDTSAVINGGNEQAIILSGTYFELRKIHAKGNGRKEGNTTNGIQIDSASNVMMENIRTEGFQKSGLEVKSSNQIQLKRVFAVNNGFCGIHVTGNNKERSKNIEIRDSKAENNPGDPTAMDNHSGNGILVGFSDSVLIDHCTATNNGWDMPRIGNGPVGIWTYESSYVTIQYCISYKNRTSKGGKDGGGFDFDGGVTNSVMQYCLSYENEGAGYGLFQYWGASLWHSNIVRYCLSINDATTTEGSGGIFVWNGSPDSVQLADCFIYNNLIYSTLAPSVQFEPSSLNKNFNFFNNIFIGRGEIVHGPSSGERFLGNVWYSAGDAISFRNYKNLNEWSTKTNQEKLNGDFVGKQIDPMINGPFLTNLTDPYQLNSLRQYNLKSNSPVRDNGLDLHSFFKIQYPKHDFFGNSIPKGKGIEPGIHEIQE